MKAALLFLALAVSSQVTHATCVALDYQEMKEMKPSELLGELCIARTKAKEYRNEADEATIYGSKLSGFGSNAEVDEAYAKGDRLRELAATCTNQATRMERVLTASGIDDAAVKQRCATSQQESKK